MYMYLKIFITVLALVGPAYSLKNCPFSMGKFPFETDRITGDWNVIASSSPFITRPPKCGRISIKPMKNAAITQYSGIINDKTIQTDIYSEPLFGEEKTSSISLAVVLGKKAAWHIGPYIETVLATDYDTYAVYLSCRNAWSEKTKKFERDLTGAVLAREKTLDPVILETLKNLLSGYDIDPENIYNVDQSSCDNEEDANK